MEWKNCTKDIAKILDSWCVFENIRKYAMFDSTFTEELEYYQKNTYEEKIQDFVKVIYFDKILMGYVVLNYYHYDGIYEVGINPIVIHPKYQSLGYGKEIVSYLLKHIEELVEGKVDQVFALIDKTNVRSIQLFKHLGFIQKEEDSNFLRYYYIR